MSQGHENFGKYILLEKLATGGMAEIYLARSPGASGVSKFVALKRILPQYSEQPEFIDMFKDEAKIAVNLTHANITSIFEFGVEKQAFYLAMDYVEGRNLRQILNKMKKSGVSFSIEQVLYIIKEVAAGLDHAHRCIDSNTGKPLNIIHRDMSPQNVMISFEGEVKVIDFGIAKAETQLETTRAGTLKGKFGYMSPEQAEGQQVDLRTDIFALGIVLWELLANDRLFVANNEVNTLRKIRDCQIPSLRKINPNIPPELERIVSKALAKDRNLRYQTAAAFHRELSRFLNRQYPDFSPHDFSVFIKTLFAAEILDSRKKMVEYSKIEQNSDPGPNRAQVPDSFVTQTNSITENSALRDDYPQNFNSEPEPPPPPKKRPQQTPPPVAPRQPSHQQPIRDRQGDSPQGWNTSNLSVDRSSYRDNPREASGMIPRDPSFTSTGSSSATGGTYYGSSRSYSMPRKRSFATSMPGLLIVFGLGVGGATYFAQNPDSLPPSLANMIRGILGTSKPPTPEPPIEQPSTGKLSFDIYVSSKPPGAEIMVNDKPMREVTPAILRLEQDQDIKLSLHLRDYKPFEERFKVSGTKVVSATLQTEKKAYIDIQVVGAGRIYVDNRLVAEESPALDIAIPADREVIVSAYDPINKLQDARRVKLGPGQHQSIRLVPRTRPQKK